MGQRVTRANGDASRRKILDAAREIAGERGYSGTSISEVSQRSGVSNSSIYWHFKDKDELFAAVIRDSYEQWRSNLDGQTDDAGPSAGDVLARLHESLTNFPAFLHFGQLVVLEQRDHELGARKEFLRIRKQSLKDLADIFMRLTDIDKERAQQLAAIALALTDGAFLARAAGERVLNDGSILSRAFDAIAADR